MRIRPAAMTLALLALVAGLAAAAVMPSSAAASTKPCWEQVIDDWLDNGTIDGHYKASCYQQALKRVPEDLRDYSNITDAISAALSASLRGDGNGNGTTTTGGGNGTGSGSGSGSSDPNGGPPRKPLAAPDTSLYSQGINHLGTTKASSIPIPLLVLAALGALLLLSAGGLAASKRIKAHRPAPPR
jgi:hypothetical protein